MKKALPYVAVAVLVLVFADKLKSLPGVSKIPSVG